MNPPADELVVKIRGISNELSSFVLVRVDLMARELVMHAVRAKGLFDRDFALGDTNYR